MKARNPSTGNLETVYVKALDSMPVGTEVDFDGTSADIPTGWEQVASYSTNEIKTGDTWIDGRPIYRKVIEANNVSLSSSGVNIPSGITNVGVVTKLDINMKFTDNSWFSFWHLTDIKLANNNDITLYTDSSSTATFQKIYIIIEYTKTTD